MAKTLKPMGRGISHRVDPVTTIVGDKPDVVSLDPPVKWQDSPAFEGQFEQDGQYRQDKMFVRVYDLAEEADLTKYGELLHESTKTDPSRVIVTQERQYCEKTGNWKVYIEYMEIKYRVLTEADKKDNMFNQVNQQMESGRK